MSEKPIRQLTKVDFDAVDEYVYMVLSYMDDSVTRVFDDQYHFVSILKQYISDVEEVLTIYEP